MGIQSVRYNFCCYEIKKKKNLWNGKYLGGIRKKEKLVKKREKMRIYKDIGKLILRKV